MKERFCCGPRKKVSPSVSAPLHLILQAPTRASHEWKKVPGVHHLCQLCHLTVDGQGVRCKDCGISAHTQCGNFYPPVTTATTANHFNSNNLVTTASVKSSISQRTNTPTPISGNSSFEPRIKKLLQISIPVPPPNSIHSDHSHSTRLSSCGGDSSSTAILVGTVTISATETPRSESKTPETTTITPGLGSDIGEDPGSLSERVQQDSGCGGLLDAEEIDGISDDSQQRREDLGQLEVRSDSELTTRETGTRKEPTDDIRYLDGPLDGALYALVNPVLKPKGPSSADSGISVTVDQMKDLDRLLNALVQDAESIPDIPYHARQDSLPFSYGIRDQTTLRLRQQQQERRAQKNTIEKQQSSHSSSFSPQQQQQHVTYASSTPVVMTSSSSNYYPSPVTVKSSPPPPPPPPPPLSSSTLPHLRTYRSGTNGTEDVVDYRNLPTSTYYPSSPKPQQYNQNSRSNSSQFERTTQSQLQQPRVQHLHLDLDDQIIPRGKNNSDYGYYSTEIEKSVRMQQEQQQKRYDRERQQRENSLRRDNGGGRSEFYSTSPIPTNPQTSPLTYNDFGVTNPYGNSTGRRLRSQSADGRRNIERSEDADAWLARQMQRLQEKKTSKFTARADFLAELKRSLPSEKSLESTNHLVRPSSAVAARIYSRSNVSTPAWYSSDDEEFDREVEREMFQTPINYNNQNQPNFYSSGRGRRVQRFHSDNAFDRIQRAPSQQSVNSSIAGSEVPGNTPGFPICPPTPYLNRPLSPGKPPRSPKTSRRSGSSTPTTPTITVNEWVISNEPVPRMQTPVNPNPVFMVESEVKFARDLSAFWYKANASREETISALRYERTGAFIIRNSNSFPGAYGLAIKVDESSTSEDSVRHFLIEPTKYGVRLRGSAVEPVFSSLSALVYAHSIETLALPANLTLPTSDSVLPSAQSQSTTAHLLSQGAACQLLFLGVIGVECVTGDDAVSRGVRAVDGIQTPTVVSLRLSKNGLTLTDVFRQRFFRLHFPLNGISYAAVDPHNRTISYENSTRKIFAVIARPPSAAENSCVVLAELEEGQPAHAIIAFFQRVIAWQN